MPLWNSSVIHYETGRGGGGEEMKVQINKFLFIIPLLESLPQKSLEGFNLLSTKDNKRHCISHLKCGPENLLHSHQQGPGWERLKHPTFSQSSHNTHQSNPSFAIPLTLYLFQSVTWKRKTWEFWRPVQRLRTKLQDHTFPLSPSIIWAQRSGPAGGPHATPDGSAKVYNSSSRYSKSGRNWGQEHLQGAARWGNSSLTAATPQGWTNSRRKEERLPREMVFPRSTQTANHSLPWYKVVELVRTEDLLDLFFYFCLVRM